jgi:serine/threonine protein kinase
LLGTSGYLSPEIINGEQLTPKTDVFGFGLILYEILSRDRAFQQAMTIMQTARVFVTGGRKDVGPDSKIKVNVCRAARTLVSCCWDSDPGERPDFNRILNLLWLWQNYFFTDASIDNCEAFLAGMGWVPDDKTNPFYVYIESSSFGFDDILS